MDSCSSTVNLLSYSGRCRYTFGLMISDTLSDKEPPLPIVNCVFINNMNMKYLENLTTLLGKPVSPKDFELHHQLKLLKIEVAKLQKDLRECVNERILTESLLNSTIEDLRISNQKIRQLRRIDLDSKSREIEFKEKQLAQITGSMTSSMCYLDQNYVYRYINHKYEEWFGIKKEDMIGNCIEDIAPSIFNRYKAVYDKVMSGDEVEVELDMIVPSGKRMIFKSTYVPAYDIDGNNIGLYIYGTDITENKLQTESLENKEKQITKINDELKQYIESNVQLEQFAHIAAHDMKAPLRTISCFSGILEKKIEAKLEQGDKKYFQYIKEGTQSLSTMVSDLLNYSRVKSQGLITSEFQLPDLINKVLRYLEESLSSSNANIILDVPQITMVADRNKLYQVLQNLISNAVKFSKTNMRPIVKVNATDKKDNVLISISDNGIGIPKECRTEIFDPYKQLNTKQKFKGTGLGLSICNRIIRDHKGEIVISDSQLGGTKVEFVIPKFI